jgi:O-antigen ligase
MILLLALLLSVIVIGIMFPYGFPLFILLLLPALLVTIITKKRVSIPKPLWLLFLLECIYISALVFTHQVYSSFVKELINILTMDLYLILLFSYISEKKALQKFLHIFENIISFTSISIAITGLYKFFMLLQGQTLSWVRIDENTYPWGTSLVGDYNSFSLGLSLGLLYFLDKLEKTKKGLPFILTLLSIIIISICIISSGSRRGALSIAVIFFSYGTRWTFKSPAKTSIRIKKMGISLALIVLVIIGIQTLQIDIEINTSQIKLLVDRLCTIADTSTLTSARSIRWDLSYDLINEQTSLLHILFGNGFNYLSTFNQTFSTSFGEDYPHNILLSSLLYSGIIGTLCLVLFLMQSCSLIIKSRKKHFNLTVFYGLTLFTLFTSANTIFSSKLAIAVLSLPYLIYTISSYEFEN